MAPQTIASDEHTMRLVELHRYERARRQPLSDEIYRADASVILDESAGLFRWVAVAVRVCVWVKRMFRGWMVGTGVHRWEGGVLWVGPGGRGYRVVQRLTRGLLY
jgi:hypothetical protein